MKFGAYLIAGSVAFCCGISGSVLGQHSPSILEFPTTAEPAYSHSLTPETGAHDPASARHATGMACFEKLVNWTSLCKLRVAAIAMQRASTGSSAIVTDELGNNVVNSSQFGFDYAPGIDIGLLCPLTQHWDLSFRYFGLDAANASASGTVTTLEGAIATSPPTVFDGGPVSFTYRSRLQSGEVNVGTKIDEGSSFFAGFRMVEVREQLRGNFQSLAPFAYNVDTNNKLYGFQTGAETTIWMVNDRFRMDCFGKVGILANFAEQDSSITQPPGSPFASASASDRLTSLLAEAGLVATCKLTRNCSVQFGYQVLWMDGLAIATEQAGSTGNLSNPGAASAGVGRSDVLYHGGFVGLELSY